jgi:hypothetical protein
MRGLNVLIVRLGSAAKADLIEADGFNDFTDGMKKHVTRQRSDPIGATQQTQQVDQGLLEVPWAEEFWNA